METQNVNYNIYTVQNAVQSMKAGSIRNVLEGSTGLGLFPAPTVWFQ